MRPQLQRSVNRVVFQRNPNLYFKISTESVVSVLLTDSDGAQFEEGREYELIDLGSRFVDPATHQRRERLLADIVNARLSLTEGWYFKDIKNILGKSTVSYTDMARALRTGKKDTQQYTQYWGFNTLVDMCTGDVAQMLLLLRDIVAQAGGAELFRTPSTTIPLIPEVQDTAIRRLGGHFLERVAKVRFDDPEIRKRVWNFLQSVGSVQDEVQEGTFDLGVHLQRIVQAIGTVAHWEVQNLNSRNVKGNPPKQPCRIEVKDPIEFPTPELEIIYSQLLQYGLLIRDVRGKSRSGAVVPRLHLRRLLLPKFRLTFSQRDNVGLSIGEFLLMLTDPAKWERHMCTKRRRTFKWGHQVLLDE